ncbi:MAG: N-acetylneuraminate synthase [Candidatus Omnitrophota bacterium]|nr:N-acetylneuraminate synthase [Candidatus Omnitrophota bacterium]
MRRYVTIAGRKIGEGRPVFIIAEAGVNHNGSLAIAMKMVDAAKNAGADAVKFQTFRAEELVVKDAPKAAYQKRAVPGKSQFQMLKSLELSEEAFKRLSDHCKKRKILFLSTPFDLQSATLLNRLGVSAFKISSGEITNTPLLKQAAGYGKPIILSTGMSTLREVREAVDVIYSAGNRRLILLHCTSNYPARYEDANLRAIVTLQKNFDCPVGYSDHTEGLEASIAATALGACVIERHFTLDRAMKGPDHKASLDVKGLEDLVRSVRNTEKSMGGGIKAPASAEEEVKRIARKSVVALEDIPKGRTIRRSMLTVKRPGTGLSPKYLYILDGKKAKLRIKKDEVLTSDMI